ncbi:MAG: Flp family type IVb pilin [Geobacter sp.]|nr:Flp family type IVb pilin [Geobacter sp.]
MGWNSGINSSLKLLRNHKGQTLVEYGLLLILIAVVVIAIVTAVGRSTNNVYSTANSAIEKATGGGG